MKKNNLKTIKKKIFKNDKKKIDKMDALNQQLLMANRQLRATEQLLRLEIIEQRKTTDQLNESKLLLSQIIRGNAVPAFIINKQHIITHWNNACENLTGISANEIVGTKKQWSAFYAKKRAVLADFIVDETSDEKITKKYGDICKKSVISKGAYEGEFYFSNLGKNGKWLFFTAVALRNNRGEIIGAIETLQDITERKLTEEKLRESKKRYETIIKNNPDMIMIQDEKGKVIYVSEHSKEVLGWSADLLLGKVNSKWFHPDDFERVMAQMKKAYEGKSVKNLEVRCVSCDGKTNWISQNATPVFKKGKIISVQSNIRNINQLKEAEFEKEHFRRQLIQSQKMEAMGVLAGGIAHDFNNILTAIMGDAELLLQEKNMEERFKSDLENIKSSTNRAADLVKQLLIFSRKEMVTMEALDLNKTVDDSVKMLKRIIGEQINIKLDISKEKCFIQGDKGNINQILMNLAVNARDAMPTGGNLRIITKKCYLTEEDVIQLNNIKIGEHVKMVIEDTGLGMTKKIKQKIFEPFFTSKGLGTGLGLSVVLGIVQTHNASINVYSEPGIGTTFNLYFPLINVESKVENKVKNIVIKGNGEKILVIEDEVFIQRMLRRIFERSNYKGVFAGSLAQAEEIYKRDSDSIDLVLCDMILPDSDGIKIIKKLNKIKPIKKVIFTSGYLDDQSCWKEIYKNNIPFIHKPFNMNALLRVISETLG